MYSNNKKNIGVVGAGYWGKNLVRIFNELVGKIKDFFKI